MPNHTIKDQVNNLNDQNQKAEELGRWIRMHVLRVSASVPDIVTKRKRRHIAPRAVEVTKNDARVLIEILQHGLDADLPGAIGFTLYGREEL